MESLLEVLRASGFKASELYDEQGCFDFIAKDDHRLMVAKVAPDIDRFSSKLSYWLKKVANILSAAPVIIGLSRGSESIENGVVYDKFNVPTTNINTLKQALAGFSPYLYFKAGRYYVKIDGASLKSFRERLNISLGDLARTIGVSRRTIYEYERSGMLATIETAMKLQEAVETKLLLPIDIFESRSTPVFETDEARGVMVGAVSKKLSKLGLKTYTIERAPFNIIAKNHDFKILVKVSGKLSKKVKRQIRTVESMANVSGSLGITIIKDGEDEELKALNYGEFKRIKSRNELLEVIGAP
ncbi:MAG: helix-turn-helix domain-containing protein [Candidatus Nezhaarchaeales archaeon]